ncbi:MAG: hypothetical protein D3925_01820, partial [Candidatus Electrothrix sp. AR5]|nr:hypothetical protein [Candidatus Electrothrix sp. AR5]
MNLNKLFIFIFSILLVFFISGCKKDKKDKEAAESTVAIEKSSIANRSKTEISIENGFVTEGDEGSVNLKLTVSCSVAPRKNRDVTVNWSTAEATGTNEARATAGEDYASRSGVLTFKKGGSQRQEITITVKSDIDVEEDELFLVTLAQPVNATITNGIGEALILNDDSGGTPKISNETKYANLPNGTVIADHFNDFSQNDYDGDAVYKTISVSGQEFSEAVQVGIQKAPSADSRVNMMINSPIQLHQDDIILVSFYAKTVTASSTGAGHLKFLLQHNGEPWTEYVSWPLDLGTEWKKYYIPFSLSRSGQKRGYNISSIQFQD